MTVPEQARRRRLEDYLLDSFPTVSKMYLRELVRDERCEVNGRPENIGYRLRSNDLIEIWIDATRGTAMIAEEIPLNIVYEDAQLVVVDKPEGLLVHPSHRERRGTLLNGLAHYLNRGDGPLIRPGLVHRLDKGTSGLIVVAKSPAAHRSLSRSFLKKRVEKQYVALVEGVVEASGGTVTEPIGRCAETKHWGVSEDGRHAETRFSVNERFSTTTLLDLEPVTGRTNQLRIHCQAIGHPIVGDVRRGGRAAERLYLHAAKLSFPHPNSNELITFESAPNFPEIT